MQDFDPNVPKQEQGLILKYHVERVDGKPVGEGIFLEFEDRNAWAPLRTWADLMITAGYVKLGVEVREKINNAIERKEFLKRSVSAESSLD